MPGQVTTSRSAYSAEMPFEVAAWVLQQLDVKQTGAWVLVVSEDQHGRLPSQLLSARTPTAMNVVLGLANLSSNPTDLQIAGKWARDNVAPAILQADGLVPVDWNRSATQYKPSHTGSAINVFKTTIMSITA